MLLSNPDTAARSINWSRLCIWHAWNECRYNGYIDIRFMHVWIWIWIWIIVARSRRLSQWRVVALYGRAESRHLKVDTVSDWATDEGREFHSGIVLCTTRAEKTFAPKHSKTASLKQHREQSLSDVWQLGTLCSHIVRRRITHVHLQLAAVSAVVSCYSDRRKY